MERYMKNVKEEIDRWIEKTEGVSFLQVVEQGNQSFIK